MRTALIACAAVLGCAQQLHAAPPNVVFVLADDLGWGDLGCYGGRVCRTPHLDKLARQGTLFTQFYVNGPVCSPSRAAFLTGQFPARHAIHGHYSTPAENTRRGMSQFLDPKAPSVARQLKAAGYVTAHVGKWHLGYGASAPSQSAYGFDATRVPGAPTDFWPLRASDFPDFWPKCTSLFVDESIKFLEANKDRPFYLQLWAILPHGPLNPTEEQMKPFESYSMKGFPYRSAQTVYAGSVADLDAQVGRLLAKLEELKLADNTLVLFSSDNGPEAIEVPDSGHGGVGSTGPLRGRKRSLYEGGVRVPLIARGPGVPAGRVDDESVICGADFLPTLCKLAGAELPADQLDGEDRSAALTGKPGPRTNPLFWEWRFQIHGHVSNRSPSLAIRDGNWKLLMNPDRSRVELYDIPADPQERADLSAAHPEVVDRLASRVLAWRATLPPGPSDPGAGKDDYPWPVAKK